MGGDDVLGRPLGGACVPTQLLLSDLREASEDASLSQSIRMLALDLAASSAPSFEGLRAVYRALGVAKGAEKAPSLEEALSGGGGKSEKKNEEEPNGIEAEANQTKKSNPALAARLQALRDASDQAAYDACVADLTRRERDASARSGVGLSASLAGSVPAAGLALAASAGTGYAVGFVAARALFPDELKNPAARFIGGLMGLVAAMAVEAGLVVVRAVRAENEDRRRQKGLGPLSSSSSLGIPMPRITTRLTEAELAAEAEVAAAVVEGAATAARAGAEAKAAEAAKAAELAAENDSEAAAGEAKKQR